MFSILIFFLTFLMLGICIFGLARKNIIIFSLLLVPGFIVPALNVLVRSTSFSRESIQILNTKIYFLEIIGFINLISLIMLGGVLLMGQNCLNIKRK